MNKPKCQKCHCELGDLTPTRKGNRLYRECSNDDCDEEAFEFVDGPRGPGSVMIGRFTRESREGSSHE